MTHKPLLSISEILNQVADEQDPLLQLGKAELKLDTGTRHGANIFVAMSQRVAQDVFALTLQGIETTRFRAEDNREVIAASERTHDDLMLKASMADTLKAASDFGFYAMLGRLVALSNPEIEEQARALYPPITK